MEPLIVFFLLFGIGGIVALAALMYILKNLHVVAQLIFAIMIFFVLVKIVRGLFPDSQSPTIKEQDSPAVPSPSQIDSLRAGQIVLDISCPNALVGTPACTAEGKYLWLQSLPTVTPTLLAYAKFSYAKFSLSGVTIDQTVTARREDIFTIPLSAFVGPFHSREEAQTWIDTAHSFVGERDFYSFHMVPIVAYIGHLSAEQRIVAATQESLRGKVVEASYGSSGSGLIVLQTDAGTTANLSIAGEIPNAPSVADAGLPLAALFTRVHYERAGRPIILDECPDVYTNGAEITIEKEGKILEHFCAEGLILRRQDTAIRKKSPGIGE